MNPHLRDLFRSIVAIDDEDTKIDAIASVSDLANVLRVLNADGPLDTDEVADMCELTTRYAEMCLTSLAAAGVVTCRRAAGWSLATAKPEALTTTPPADYVEEDEPKEIEGFAVSDWPHPGVLEVRDGDVLCLAGSPAPTLADALRASFGFDDFSVLGMDSGSPTILRKAK